MNDQEKLMSVFALAYLLIAKLMKLTPSKEGFQLVLLMLGEDGIQACAEVADQGPEAVALTMVEVILTKQTLKAAKGAKLNRIMALNNACPEGYMKKGGKCKKCEKGSKISNGVFANAGITQYFKDGDVVKYQQPAKPVRLTRSNNSYRVDRDRIERELVRRNPDGTIDIPLTTSNIFERIPGLVLIATGPKKSYENAKFLYDLARDGVDRVTDFFNKSSKQNLNRNKAK